MSILEYLFTDTATNCSFISNGENIIEEVDCGDNITVSRVFSRKATDDINIYPEDTEISIDNYHYYLIQDWQFNKNIDYSKYKKVDIPFDLEVSGINLKTGDTLIPITDVLLAFISGNSITYLVSDRGIKIREYCKLVS